MILTAQATVIRRIASQARPWRVSGIGESSKLARLLSSLAVLEQRDGQLNHASLSAITAAQKLGGPVTAFVAGSKIGPVAEQIAKVNGLGKVIKIENGSYDKAGPLPYRPVNMT